MAKITPEEFNKLSNNDKWTLIWAKKIKNALWYCLSCGELVDEGITPTTMFMGERYCGTCGSLLTKRNNGGQNMPCNYIFKYKEKRKISSIEIGVNNQFIIEGITNNLH